MFSTDGQVVKEPVHRDGGADRRTGVPSALNRRASSSLQHPPRNGTKQEWVVCCGGSPMKRLTLVSRSMINVSQVSHVKKIGEKTTTDFSFSSEEKSATAFEQTPATARSCIEFEHLYDPPVRERAASRL